MLSFLIFPKPLDAAYMMGVLLVLLGLALNVMVKANDKKDKEEKPGDEEKDKGGEDGTLKV